MDVSQGQMARNGRRSAIALVTAPEMHSSKPAGFAESATRLITNGYSPIPIAKGTKRPFLKGWSRLCETTLTADEIAEIAAQHPDAGIGVATGYGGLIGIDIDVDDPEVHRAVRRAIGEGGCPRRGSKGFCSFFRLADDQPAPTRQFRGLIDVLGHGRCAIIPPTRHPSGTDYAWLTSATLFSVALHQLPIAGER